MTIFVYALFAKNIDRASGRASEQPKNDVNIGVFPVNLSQKPANQCHVFFIFSPI